MNNTVYKVVKFNTYPNQDRGVYESSFVTESELKCQYQVGQTTTPKVNGTKLFAFKDKSQAVYYAKLSSGHVLECEATGVGSTNWLYDEHESTYMKEFFNIPFIYGHTPEPSFDSVVACDSLTPTKVISKLP